MSNDDTIPPELVGRLRDAETMRILDGVDWSKLRLAASRRMGITAPPGYVAPIEEPHGCTELSCPYHGEENARRLYEARMKAKP